MASLELLVTSSYYRGCADALDGITHIFEGSQMGEAMEIVIEFRRKFFEKRLQLVSGGEDDDA